ncbi:MAG: hypothetical protein DRN90_00300 [Thermoproteota archaeon]|nr:MAG: hypothetical protein DRN90_00300 [Candidatus Korarchaeota archaeon]
MDGVKILWVSRHNPLPSQVKELERKLGKIEIVQFAERVPNAEFVIELAKKHGAKIIVPVLPLSIIARLVELANKEDITVLWAEMEQVKMLYNPVPFQDYDPTIETVVAAGESYKVMRFKRFHKIKAIRLELEEW